VPFNPSVIAGSIEFLKDGTGILKQKADDMVGVPITWKTEKNRLIITQGGQATMAFDYEVSEGRSTIYSTVGPILTIFYDRETDSKAISIKMTDERRKEKSELAAKAAAEAEEARKKAAEAEEAKKRAEEEARRKAAEIEEAKKRAAEVEAEKKWRAAGFIAKAPVKMTFDQAKSFCLSQGGRLPLFKQSDNSVEGFGIKGKSAWPSGLSENDEFWTGSTLNDGSTWTINSRYKDPWKREFKNRVNTNYWPDGHFNGLTLSVICVPK